MLKTVRDGLALLHRSSWPWLAAYVLAAVLVSALEALGLGMIYVFFDIALSPDTLGGIAPVRHLHAWLGAPASGRFLSMLSIAVIVAFILRALVMLLASWIALALRRKIETELVAKLFRSYLAKPLTWHAARGTSHMLNNVAHNVGHVIQHVIIGALDIVGAALMIGFLLATMAWLRPTETLVVGIVLMMLGASYLAIAQKYIVRWGRVMVEASEAKWRMIREPLRGIKTVKNMGIEEYFARHVDASMRRYLDVFVRQSMAQTAPRHVLEVLLVGGILGVIGSAFAAGASASHVIPAMVLFATAGMRLLPQASRAIQALQYIQFSEAALAAVSGDIRELHSAGAGALARPSVVHEQPAFASLTLREVSYRYPNADRDALHAISLELRAGEHVALVGLSGAGKTTLADILLGLVEPARGALLIDRKNVDFIPRGMFAYVPQESFIVGDTLRRNIALGVADREIDEHRVLRAATGAAFGAFIARQPHGLDTRLNEDGANLSGGEKQRLGIARALYRECHGLVLDEPTSSLDALTEAEISATIASLRGIKTVVLVAHRLSTIKNFDRIVFMEDGCVSAVGSFAELYRRYGRFKTMVDFLSVSHLPDTSSENSMKGIPAL